MQHVAFPRAINVGGRAIVKMTDLKKAAEGRPVSQDSNRAGQSDR